MFRGDFFIWALVGIDPGPERPPYPFRLLILLAAPLIALGVGALCAGVALLWAVRALRPSRQDVRRASLDAAMARAQRAL